MTHILVIDDNDDMLTMLQMLLERRGKHEVTTSNNGTDGLEKAISEIPDIMIVDVMMPGMNGYDVVNRIRADSRTKTIPIIILTARGQPVDRNAALEVGANAHLAKPVDIQELLSTIDDLLEFGSYANLPDRLILPVMSLRGGVGVTSIAVNLALLFQQIAPTILWDLSPSSGHGALNLGLQPKPNWAKYLQSPDLSVNDLLLNHSSGLRLLAAPPVPDTTLWFDNGSILELQSEILKLCSILVIDMPSFIDTAMVPILQNAHQIVLISGDDNPGIQTTLATMQTITSMLEEKNNQTMIVHNSPTPIKHNELEIFQRALGQPVTENIPYDESQRSALRKGIPLAVSNKNTPMMVKLKHLAQTILK